MKYYNNFNSLFNANTTSVSDIQIFNGSDLDEDLEAKKISNEFIDNFNTIYPDIKRLEKYINEESLTIELDDLSATQLSALIKSLDLLQTCTKTMKKAVKAWLKTDYYKNK